MNLSNENTSFFEIWEDNSEDEEALENDFNKIHKSSELYFLIKNYVHFHGFRENLKYASAENKSDNTSECLSQHVLSESPADNGDKCARGMMCTMDYDTALSKCLRKYGCSLKPMVVTNGVKEYLFRKRILAHQIIQYPKRRKYVDVAEFENYLSDVPPKVGTIAMRAAAISQDFIAELWRPKFDYILPCVASGSSEAKPISMKDLEFSNAPVECPIESCFTALFPSNLIWHVSVNHKNVPVVVIKKLNLVNIFLNPQILNDRQYTCLSYLSLDGKMKYRGDKKNKPHLYYLPMMVMATAISSVNLFNSKAEENTVNDYIMIFLAGYDYSIPIHYTLSAWRIPENGNPACNHAITNQVISIRGLRDRSTIIERCLLLSPLTVKRLTLDNEYLISLQLIIH